jgi:uncharacterized protein (TIGR03084 family)
MKEILTALAAQETELDGLLASLDDDGWSTAVPRCPGWSVADVVLHLAQTDEAGVASAEGGFGALNREGGPASGVGTVDDVAAYMVDQQRGEPPAAVHARWRAAAEAERKALARRQPSDRVRWVAGDMAARTLATTRLSETWIHTGDIADAVGADLAPTDRLWHIARLAWRTLPYAFERAGEKLSGPVAVTLTAPDGDEWRFADDVAATTVVNGPAVDWCMVAARRADPDATALQAEGPDADAVLRLVRTYA